MLGDNLKSQEDDSLKLLEELALNHAEDVKEKRIHGRFKLKAPFWVSPGNLSQREEFSYEGSTRDLSTGGMLAVLPSPLAVGDIYHLSFDRQVLDLPPLTARCVKCRMVEGEAFEVALAFFQAVEFPGSSEGE